MTAHRTVQIVDTVPLQGTLPPASMPTTTSVGAILICRNENTLTPALVACTTGGAVRVSASQSGYTATSRSTGSLEQQRGITFGCSLGFVRVFVDPTAATLVTIGTRNIAAWLIIVNKGSAATNGDVPHGALVYGLEAGETREINTLVFQDVCTSGLRAVLSTTSTLVTLGPTGLFSVHGLP